MGAILQINGLHKQYGPRILFNDASVVLSSGIKYGVIGRNGAGKSTLFNMLVGKEEPDSGTVWVPDDMRLSYLEQKDTHEPGETVIDFLMRTTEKENWECGKVAGRFQVKNELLKASVDSLSGGYRMRVRLAAMMLKEPNLLLLDEPTNYLDLKTVLMLEAFLKDFRGAALVISHDREFLMRTCDQTVEVDDGKVMAFPGSVEEYLEYKQEVKQQIIRENENIELKRAQLSEFVLRFRAKASKAAQAQSKMKQMEKLKIREISGPGRKVRMMIPSPDRKGGIALRCKNLKIGYDDYVIAEKIDFELHRGGRYAVLGDNGMGKSTFLKTIQGMIPALSGETRWGHEVKTGYYAQHVYESLEKAGTVLQYLEENAVKSMRRQEVLNLAGSFLFGGDETKKAVSVLSGGEKSRLVLLGLMMAKCDVLILDEPTNHLDFETVEVLAEALRAFTGTVFFVSHDRTFVNTVATSILDVRGGTIELYAGTYEEYVYRLENMIQSGSDDADPFARKAEAKTKSAAKTEANVDAKSTAESAGKSEAKSNGKTKAGGKAEKKGKDKEFRAMKKEYDSLHTQMDDLIARRQSLLSQVEAEPQSVGKEQYDEIAELTASISSIEEKWLAIGEKLQEAEIPV